MRRAALAVLLAVAACGEDGEPEVLATSTSSTSSTVPIACPAATDVAAIVDPSFAAPALTATGPTTCSYTFGDATVTLNVERGAGKEAHEQYDRLGDREPVSGLGDDAAWSAEQRVLTVLDGDDVVMVLVDGVADLRGVAVAVARLVVD